MLHFIVERTMIKGLAQNKMYLVHKKKTRIKTNILCLSEDRHKR